MGRYRVTGLSASRVYPVKTAARIVGVSEVTFRKWGRKGLRIIKEKRPHLVRGEDLIAFLKKLQAASIVVMREGQFFCFRCKAPCDAKVGSVSYVSYTVQTGRISAVCDVCGCSVGRFSDGSDAPP